MSKEGSKGITVQKADDIAEWYGQVVQKAELADYAPVKGCMVIRPNGYALWENLTAYFNERIRLYGVENAYFPLFIPESFFYKEAQHAQGFKPEVAWIANKYEGERIAVRPTSETIMYDSYSRWVRSHRDLPIRMNQWCNVVRWETAATKMFLRTREFLWQEGHCAYATQEEAEKETQLFLDEYEKLAREQLALHVVKGKKTRNETFAGAVYSLTIEAFMPDGKALQCGTSHYLGDGFAKSFDIKFVGEDEKEHYAHQNSWGISTRLIGAIIMQHGDDKGMIMPPRIAPKQAVIVPILFDKTKEAVLAKCKEIADELNIRVHVDDREDYHAGWKFNEWEMKGVPLRIELGPKDLEKGQAVVVRRDTGEKEFVELANLQERAEGLLNEIHENLYQKSKSFFESNAHEVKTWEAFMKITGESKIAYASWCGEESCEEEIKDKTKGVSSRCMPLGAEIKNPTCVHCGKESKHQLYFSRSY